jgi:VWFA-related protein
MRPLLLATLVALGGSQQPPQAAPPQTFRSGAQVVEVDVRAIGKDGKFITDLGLADFEITEDGVPQKLQSLVLIGRAPVAPVAPSVPAPVAPSAPFAPVAPRPPQLWVFVFDTPHLSPGGLTRTRDAVVKFIAERFHQGDIGGIVADGRMANNRLTSDHEELKKAAAAIKMTGEARSLRLEQQEWPRLRDELEAFNIANGDREALRVTVARACDEDPSACRRTTPDLEIMEKAKRLVATYKSAARLSLSVVDTLSKGLARREGPKTIVFLSEGFIIQEQEAELRQAVGQAARAGAHFYTVDARGLNTGTGANIIDQAQAESAIGVSPRFDMQADGTNSLAVDTGGFAIRNENNFGRALDDIQRDAGTYYVVGYIPERDTFDGKYRAISVKVNRPGVNVRARRGYLAVAPAVLTSPAAVPPAAPISPAAVPPKRADDSSSAKADEPPVVPISPGLLALPESTSVTLPGEAPSIPDKTASAATAVRMRINAGQMVLALGRSAAVPPKRADDSSSAKADFGGTSSALNSHAELGWAAYEKGDVETAGRELGEAAKAPDARPWVVYALGLSQFALRRYPDAAQAWERVRRDVPEFEPIYFSLADAYGLQHDEGTALKVLREAERRWPADAEVANAIGVIQIRRGALDAAIESFERATTTAPDEALGYFNLARTHQMRLLKSQRYDPQMQKWIGGDEDRRRAIAGFQKYLQLGGPYVRQAQDALSALGWK